MFSMFPRRKCFYELACKLKIMSVLDRMQYHFSGLKVIKMAKFLDIKIDPLVPGKKLKSFYHIYALSGHLGHGTSNVNTFPFLFTLKLKYKNVKKLPSGFREKRVLIS